MESEVESKYEKQILINKDLKGRKDRDRELTKYIKTYKYLEVKKHKKERHKEKVGKES